MTKGDFTMAGGKFRLRLVAAALLAGVLASCGPGGSGGPAADRSQNLEVYTPEQIFERGEYELGRNRNSDAAWYFSEIERLYPYAELAKRALIMQTFAHHQDKDYDNSRATAQRYIDFYPADQDAAYAQYLLALSYYDQIDEVGRDQKLTFQALQELRRVIELYPDSEYASSAVLKFDLAFDHLASKEMEVGRYYLKRDHYGAAINRFRSVVEDFQTTTHTAEALHRLVESYLSLGLTDEAQSAGAILGHNYQSTEWYQNSYALLTSQGLEIKARGNNWLARIYRQTLRGEWL